MKTASKMLLALLIAAGSANAQCNVKLTAMCSKACVPGTLYLNQGYCGWFAILATGATSYTWSVSGPDGAYTITGDTAKFYPQLPGITTYSVIGECPNSTYGSDQVNVEAEICPYGAPNTVGLDELTQDQGNHVPIYFDVMGTRIEKPSTGFYMELRGTKYKKFYIRD